MSAPRVALLLLLVCADASFADVKPGDVITAQNSDAVREWIPAELHPHTIDGRDCERWVLGDWYQRGSYLRCDATGCTAVQL